MFKLRQIGPNHSGNNIFAFSYFDICGEIRSDGRTRKTFGHVSGSPFQGIIAYLSRVCGGNVAAREIVNIIANPLEAGAKYSAANVVDLEVRDTHYWSKNEPNQTLAYDFIGRLVLVTHYAIRSTADGADGFNHLRSWVVEVSSNGTAWTTVDRRLDNTGLNARSAIQVFEVDEPIEGRYIRIRQTDVNYYKDRSGHINALVLSAWELFGDILE
jgi:hypothetical protein